MRPIRDWSDVVRSRPDGRAEIADLPAFKALIGLEVRQALLEQVADSRGLKNLETQRWAAEQARKADAYLRSIAEQLHLSEEEAFRRWGIRPKPGPRAAHAKA
ncbi:MAG: hypothetical protein M3R49_03690 [Chloroflexota bacterium]|nr:hypothetical protein [Chloroflexota bacterium]